MQVLGPSTTGPAWLLPMASTIPLRTPTGRAVLESSSSYSLLQRKWFRYWCALTGEPLTPGAGLQVTVSPLTPPIQPQPQVKEWIELFDKRVISREELRHQLALATANAISSPTLDDSPATRAGEAGGSGAPASAKAPAAEPTRQQEAAAPAA